MNLNRRIRGARLLREVAQATRAPEPEPPAAPFTECKNGTHINGASDVFALVGDVLASLAQEVFVILLLTTRHRVREVAVVSTGTLDASLVHPRDVFRRAIKGNAAALVVVHNHPSGDPEPSPEDVALTRRLVAAGSVLAIPVLDHVIVGEGRWVSLAERGLL